MRLLFFALLFLLTAAFANAQSLNASIQKVFPACVRMFGFDTVRKAQNSAQFSGVVVSSEGHILTVAHAVSPNRIYKVTFPDGKECIAMALGRIVTEASTTRPDVAMMKIITNGPWPFAELGDSRTLKTGASCFGISYPESQYRLQPMVRYGVITDTMNRWGFIESGCIMETGDSGGPLFDVSGRVIALHSRIGDPEGPNYEVPILFYQKYWTALNTAKNYSELPSEDSVIQSLEKTALLLQPEKVPDATAYTGITVSIESTVRDSLQKITGTVISKEGIPKKKYGKGTLLLSKSSMVGDDPMITLPNGKSSKAQILSRDTTVDLVLLSVDASLSSGINMKRIDTSQLSANDLGKPIFTFLPDGEVKQSVIGSDLFSLSRGLRQPMGARNHPMNRFKGGKSVRRDGFQSIFVHDARIRSYECGSPVFDAAGQFRGINIARFSHATTVVIPASVVNRFLSASMP